MKLKLGTYVQMSDGKFGPITALVTEQVEGKTVTSFRINSEPKEYTNGGIEAAFKKITVGGSKTTTRKPRATKAAKTEPAHAVQ